MKQNAKRNEMTIMIMYDWRRLFGAYADNPHAFNITLDAMNRRFGTITADEISKTIEYLFGFDENLNTAPYQHILQLFINLDQTEAISLVNTDEPYLQRILSYAKYIYGDRNTAKPEIRKIEAIIRATDYLYENFIITDREYVTVFIAAVFAERDEI